jgi:hypothetical protein
MAIREKIVNGMFLFLILCILLITLKVDVLSDKIKEYQYSLKNEAELWDRQ